MDIACKKMRMLLAKKLGSCLQKLKKKLSKLIYLKKKKNNLIYQFRQLEIYISLQKILIKVYKY